jgi:hypothetical protein
MFVSEKIKKADIVPNLSKEKGKSIWDVQVIIISWSPGSKANKRRHEQNKIEMAFVSSQAIEEDRTRNNSFYL